jgi:ankyrin repeat protein
LTDLNQGSKTKPCATIPSPNDVKQSQLKNISENQTTEDSMPNSLATNARKSSSSPTVFAIAWLTEEAQRRKVLNKDPRDMLFSAVELNDEILVRICLILRRISPDIKDTHGTPVLVEAAKRGNLGVVGLLLERGATVDDENAESFTALHGAAQNGHEAVVRVLADKGATINQQTKQGVTALHVAAYNSHEAVVRVLAEKGATINQQTKGGVTALHFAAENGHEAVVRVLAEHHADIRLKDNQGRTARSVAKLMGHTAIAEFLNLDQQTKDILPLAVRALWSRIQAQPDTYLLTNLEARIFNYHQALFRGNDLARRTLARYWENTHGSLDGG